MTGLGPVGRLGRWTATHVRAVVIAWLLIAVALGSMAPRAEHALSGAGWEATGSESVEAREAIDQRFAGQGSYALQVVLTSQSQTVDEPAFRSTIVRVTEMLEANGDVSQVVAPQPGASISADRRTAVVLAGAGAEPVDMVRAADDLKEPIGALSSDDLQVSLTGASGMWSDFNQANKSAMIKSEVISWPVTLAIMLIAFGSLVAAGLPLMLTVLGLMAAAGMLFVGAQVFDISIWAMNFALMFALALGIDYALFIVSRFRQALSDGNSPVDAVAASMETAGKAVAFSGVTVLISLSAVLLVPSPAFRSMAIGIMLAVVFVLAASLTLLPAVLAKLGSRINRVSLPWSHPEVHRSERLARWAAAAWRRPLVFGLAGMAAVVVLAWPVVNLDTGMPSIAVVPSGDSSRQGYEQVQAAFGEGGPGTLQIIAPAGESQAVDDVLRSAPGLAAVLPAQTAEGSVLVQAVPHGSPSGDEVRATIDRLRSQLPPAALLGGAVAENLDLEQALSDATPLVIGVVLALGFLLLLVALQAPVIAFAGVLLNVFATLAAFGVAKWIFQDGIGADLLGFEPQGYLDAWAPVFFFAMLFALGMDYTVFLLASAKERWDQHADARDAAVEGIATSGKVITAAAAVMVAVFFTFALSGPLPPKEMGVILGVAVLIDAALVRLVLMPVLLRLLGASAWWLPRWLDRLLPDVRFGHS